MRAFPLFAATVVGLVLTAAALPGNRSEARRQLLDAARWPPLTGGHVDAVEALHIRKLVWPRHVRGAGVRVASLDTGIATHHAHFRAARDAPAATRAGLAVAECKSLCSQQTCEDGFGHGSFVAGVIGASSAGQCAGIAPGVEFHAYKVFTDQQVSYTSWFIDAFNAAMDAEVDVVNLSIGGPDYFDRPFIDKVNEVSAAGIVLVTAIGNDGPQFGVGYNPADQMDVLAVGSVSHAGRVSGFSSRGMTTWEMPLGVGRPKPDIVTFGDALWGTAHTGGCKALSGTSVASPIVTGVAALLVGVLRGNGLAPNPAMVKQLMTATADRLPDACPECGGDFFASPAAGAPRRALPTALTWSYAPRLLEAALEGSVYVQGSGALNAVDAVLAAERYRRPAVTVLPARLDMAPGRGCRYLWPHCDTPLHHTGDAARVNLTVLNAVSPNGRLLLGADAAAPLPLTASLADRAATASVSFEAAGAEDVLAVRLIPGRPDGAIWPWAGSATVSITVRRDVEAARVISGRVHVVVRTAAVALHHHRAAAAGQGDADGAVHVVEVPFSVEVVPAPPRRLRLLWDMAHQVQYPPGYLPRDDLDVASDVLDWHGDHPFLNFRQTYHVLRRAGYFIDILAADYTRVDGRRYAALLLVDTEEFFFEEELRAAEALVRRDGLSLVVFSDWFDPAVMKALSFTDDNTKEFWRPMTGGANVPALNTLLGPFGIELSASVYTGDVIFRPARRPDAALPRFASGGSVRRVPAGAEWCSTTGTLRDVSARYRGGRDNGASRGDWVGDVPVLAAVDTRSAEHPAGGRVVVFGDSNCLDSSHNGAHAYCHALLLTLVAYAADRDAAPSLRVGELADAKCRAVAKDAVLGGAVAPAVPLGAGEAALRQWASRHLMGGVSPVLRAGFSLAAATAAGGRLGAREQPDFDAAWAKSGHFMRLARGQAGRRRVIVDNATGRIAAEEAGAFVSEAATRDVDGSGIDGRPRIHGAWFVPAAGLIVAVCAAFACRARNRRPPRRFYRGV
jgi:membrane-bound transcription factor site-1 protease